LGFIVADYKLGEARDVDHVVALVADRVAIGAFDALEIGKILGRKAISEHDLRDDFIDSSLVRSFARIDRGVGHPAARAHTRNLPASTERESIDALSEVIVVSLTLLPAALSSKDVAAASRLAAQKDRFRELEDEIVRRRLGGEHADTAAGARDNAPFIDLVRDLHRTNSDIAAAGYPLVQAAGLRSSSRIMNVGAVAGAR
jgi:hypothetical protein